MTRVITYNESSPGRVIVVDRWGNGDYTKIQDAINYAYSKTPSASDQWLILVCPGAYVESLTLYDYINIAGLSYDKGVMLKPSSGSAINNLVTAYLTNFCIISPYDPLIKSGASAAGKTMTLKNVIVEEDDAEIDGIEIDSGTLVIDKCRLRFGGEVVLNSGTLKVWDSIIDHYHTNAGAATEHTILLHADTTLEIIRSTIQNTSPAGSAVYFHGTPTACKLLHSIFKKSAAATYSLDTLAAVSITMARCLINAAISGSITITGTNDTDTSI